MDRYITGAVIKELRENKQLTQAELANKLNVSDKNVSKWETGKGYPDITLLEPIAEVFGVSVAELLSGSTISNMNVSGNMLRSKFYVCPVCGNIIHSMGEAAINCHGILLAPSVAEPSDERHKIFVEKVEDEFFVQIEHDMTKEHYISFIAAVSSDRIQMVKLYPEEKPPIHLPQEGELLYRELNEPHMEHITTEMPVKIELWIDRMGARSEAVIKEKETISRLVTAFSKIKIGKESMEFVTDNYNGMIFTFEDGTEIYLSLNLKNLEYQVYNGTRVYELEQFDEFWGWMNDLTEMEDR